MDIVNDAAIELQDGTEHLVAEALERSPFDMSDCMVCGLPVICIPDGLPMCNECAEKEADKAG
jgi:hypothetical protein